MTSTRRWVTFGVLSMTGGVIFQVAYLRFVFLEDTSAALHLTGQQYGTVTSIFGATATVMYFVGGWFADRFPPRVLIAAALAGTGVADFFLSTAPSFGGVVAAHVAMAVLGMGLYWSALVKAIGLLGTKSEQGRLFGFLEGARGVTSAVVSFVCAGIVAAAVVPSTGVLTLMRIYGGLCLLFAVLVLLVVRRSDSPEATASSTVSLRDLAAAALTPSTWLIGGTIAMAFCFYTTLGYFSPLLSTGFGVGGAALGVIGVVRTYVFQFTAGPLGGVVVDRVTKSSFRFLRWSFVVCLAVAVAFLFLPRSAAYVVFALVLLLVLCVAVFTSRGVYWATVGELGVPEHLRGGVIGLASGIAYLPDAFLPALCAWWIGEPAAGVPEHGGGYDALFVFLIATAVGGIVLTSVTHRLAHARRLRTTDLSLA